MHCALPVGSVLHYSDGSNETGLRHSFLERIWVTDELYGLKLNMVVRSDTEETGLNNSSPLAASLRAPLVACFDLNGLFC